MHHLLLETLFERRGLQRRETRWKGKKSWVSSPLTPFQRNAIFEQAADSIKRKLCRSGSENVSAAKVKFPEMEKELFIRFNERRNQGRRVSARWIKKTAGKLLKNWTKKINTY